MLEVKGLPEIEEILKETARVKSELKVRTKLNRLQSTKVRIPRQPCTNTSSSKFYITTTIQENEGGGAITISNKPP